MLHVVPVPAGARRGSPVIGFLPALARALLAWALVLAAAAPAGAQVGAVLTVEVREAGSERPLADVAITVDGGTFVARTDVDGRADLRGLPPGRHVVRARHLAYVEGEAELELRNDGPSTLVLRLQPRALELTGLEVVARHPGEGVRSLTIDGLAGGIRTVVDAVERLPGVSVVRQGGPGTPAIPQIRGSAGDQVLVLVDGVAINSPLTGEADLSTVDLGQVERVTVVPGALAARYGARALAGAILIETRNPDETSARAHLTAGSLETWGAGGAATLAVDGGATTLSLGGEWQRSRGDFRYPVPALRGGGVGRRDNAETRSTSGFLQGAWQGADATGIRLRLHAREARRGSPGTLVQPSATGRNREQRVGALVQAERGTADRGWSASVGLDRQEARSDDPAPPFGQAYHATADVDQVEARLAWRGTVVGTALSAGADGRWWSLTASSLPDSTPSRIGGGGGWIRARRVMGDPDRLFAEVSGGLRLDRHDLLPGVVVSPSATLALARGPHRLELATGNAVSPPDISDLFVQEGVLVEPNPGLGPERVIGEVSVEYRHQLRGSGWHAGVGVTAYRADVRGMVLWFPDHRFVWSPLNIDVTRRGAELTADLRVGSRLSLQGEAGWRQVHYDVAALDGPVPYRPQHHADLSATLGVAGFDLTSTARWIGARRTRPGSGLNALPGHARVDAGVRRTVRIGEVRLSAEFAVDNLLDESASLLADYPLPGRTFSFRLATLRLPQNP